MNKVLIVGRLGSDPKFHSFDNGSQSAQFSVATTEYWTDRSTGEKCEETEWHNIVTYRRQAEIAGEYLKKGSQVYIEGRLQTRKWQDKQGNDRYTTEIVADHMQMLGQRDGGGASDRRGGSRQDYHPAPSQGEGREQEPRREPKPPGPAANFDDMDDDIPF